MSWYPVITFWQVTIDLMASVDVPDGHGHVYRGEVLDGWVAIAAPPGWTQTPTPPARARSSRGSPRPSLFAHRVGWHGGGR